MCYVPRTRPCESTKQCRPGTGCRPQPQVESGPTLPYVCSVLEPEVDDGSADTVAQLVTKIAFDLKNAINDNDGINATGAVQDSEGNLVLQDFHSGVLSPYLAFRNLAKHVFQDMIDSFWGAHVRHHGDSSRSGASFFYSADSLFIAKKLSRVAEWEDMVIHLLGKLASQLDFADPICDESVESCWALHAMQKTVLNIPVLAFKHHSEAWVIIPNTPVMRCYTMVGEHPGRAMQAGREGSLQPAGSLHPRNGVRELSARMSWRSGATKRALEAHGPGHHESHQASRQGPLPVHRLFPPGGSAPPSRKADRRWPTLRTGGKLLFCRGQLDNLSAHAAGRGARLHGVLFQHH